MKPCPKCGCPHTRLALAIRPGDTLVALACFNKTCDYTGPYVGPITFPPNRQDGNRAAAAWDAEIVRRSLPARLRERLPAPRYVESDYVKPATVMH
jgi:hypothetical protein